MRAAAGGDVGLSDAEFSAIRPLLEREDTWILAGTGDVEILATLIAGTACPAEGHQDAQLAGGGLSPPGCLSSPGP